MGWFESPQHPGCMLGDDAHDDVHQFLQQLAQTYHEAFARPPTLEEVRLLLETGLRVSGGEFVADLQERRVESVVFKTKKKRRDQACAVGDIFAIPLGGRAFAFGRVMLMSKAHGCLIEVFRARGTTATFSPSIASSGRRFPPVWSITSHAIAEWRWTVVASEDHYVADPADLAAIEFRSPYRRGEWVVVDLHHKILRSVTEAEAGQLESGRIWTPQQLELRLAQEGAAG